MHNYKFLINLSHFYVKLIKVSHCDSRSSDNLKPVCVCNSAKVDRKIRITAFYNADCITQLTYDSWQLQSILP